MSNIDPFGPNTPFVDLNDFKNWIIYEDNDLLVINKPGWLVCSSKNGPLSSLVGAVRIYSKLDKLHLISRLDRETSGLILIAKRSSVARKYQMAIQERKVKKEYLAILDGVLKNTIKVDQNIAHRPYGLVKVKNHVSDDRTSKSAITHFQPIIHNDKYSFARIIPETGRKHQIRVHAEWIGNPVVGDKIYGNDEELYLEFIEKGWTKNLESKLLFRRQALHCFSYSFYIDHQEFIYEAPLHKDMIDFINNNISADEINL